MIYSIRPSNISGSLSAIASKSYAHRVMIAAALADYPTRVYISSSSEDIEATIGCLESLGTRFSYFDGGVDVFPGTFVRKAVLDCRECGSTLRFLLPVAAVLGGNYSFSGSERLAERPVKPLLDELSRHGAFFSSSRIPLEVSGKIDGGEYVIPGNISSQFFSGLMFSLPLTNKKCIVKADGVLQSADYAFMTASVLEKFGVCWKWSSADNSFSVDAFPRQRLLSAHEYHVEGDWSNAAFFLVAAAMGGSATIKGISPASMQSGRKILDIIRKTGASVTWTNNSVSVCRAEILHGFETDVSQCPDLFCIVAVLAAGCRGDSVITGTKRMRIKESDRVESTVSMLRALGGNAVVTGAGEDERVIIKGKSNLDGGVTDSFNDHRIVMAAAAASAICRDKVVIKNAQAVNKSYPGFADDFAQLGGKIDVI